MEDASKEFQVFLAPSRSQADPSNQSLNKHRIVPVINKCQPSSSFVINQRKNTVLYKAISGVSFQETDGYNEQVSSKKKQKHGSGRKKTDSLTLVASPDQKSGGVHTMGANSDRSGITAAAAGAASGPQDHPSGATRSRSLSNMKSEGQRLLHEEGEALPPCSVTEITHPFTPVILYTQPRGRQSRYARARERRRASSQARPNLQEKVENGDVGGERPVRPRRTRSASRTRKKAVMQSFSSENSLNDEEILKKKYLSSYDEDHYLVTSKDAQSVLGKGAQISCNTYEDPNDIIIADLQVNETDWKKYDALITEKLDSLLRNNQNESEDKKAAEEPEGGYFSLEREEIENNQSFLDAFQQDNYNETIYVSQTFKEKSEANFKNISKENRSFELPELELADYSTVHEVGFAEDEGLYEEIFFDPNEREQHNPFYQLDVREKEAVFIPPPPPNTEPPEDTHYVPVIEQKENSTVVYIRCNDIQKKELKPSVVTLHDDISKGLSHPNSGLSSSISLESINSFASNRPSTHPAWCGCYKVDGPKRSKSVSHNSSCIQGKPGVIAAKYSSLVDLETSDHNRFINLPPSPKIVKSKRNKSFPHHQPSTGITKSTSAVNLIQRGKEPESELSDIDLEIFAPRFRESIMKRKDNIFASNSRPHRYLKRREYASMRQPSRRQELTHTDEPIPKTFKAFLQNEFFNPPDIETSVDDSESLIIGDDQTITCISDSSSDDESDADPPGAYSYSPWLEAKNEFEFVAFKEATQGLKNIPKKRKTNKLLSLHKMMYGSHHDLVQNHNAQEQELKLGSKPPERPSRKRTKRRSQKWGIAS